MSGPALPSWWPDFILRVCELPDRNSPDDEPSALIATASELESCALNAIEAEAEALASYTPKEAVSVLNPKGTEETGKDRPAASLFLRRIMSDSV